MSAYVYIIDWEHWVAFFLAVPSGSWPFIKYLYSPVVWGYRMKSMINTPVWPPCAREQSNRQEDWPQGQILSSSCCHHPLPLTWQLAINDDSWLTHPGGGAPTICISGDIIVWYCSQHVAIALLLYRDTNKTKSICQRRSKLAAGMALVRGISMHFLPVIHQALYVPAWSTGRKQGGMK